MNNEQNKNVTGTKKRFVLTATANAVLSVAAAVGASWLLANGYGAAGLLLCALASAFLGVLLCSTRSFLCILTVPAAFSVSYLVSGIFPALVTLIFAGVASAIMISVQKKSRASSAILTGAVVSALFLIAIGCVALYDRGELSFALIRELFDEWMAEMKAAVTASFTDSDAMQILEQAAGNLGLTGDQLITALVNTVGYVSPALFTVTAWLFSFVGVQLFKLVCRALSMTILLPDPKWRFEPSPTTTIVFFADYLLYILSSLFSGSATDAFFIVVENLFVMISVPLMISGIITMIRMLTSRDPRKKRAALTFVIILVISFILLPMSFIFVLSMLGTVDTVAESLKKRMNKSGGSKN